MKPAFITYMMILYAAFARAQISIPYISADDYPVTKPMLKENRGDKKSGELISVDKVWFTNDSIKQTLAFELYTDLHRLYIYHFYNDTIPEDLIDKIDLHQADSRFRDELVTANKNQKLKFFKGFVSSAQKAGAWYFVSQKGFGLGDEKQKATAVYGPADELSSYGEFEKLEWTFGGDYMPTLDGDYIQVEANSDKNGKKPIVRNSFGYSVTMYFKQNRLVGMIIFNDIP